MLYFIGGLLGLLLIIIVLLQIPAIQTKITQEIASRFEKQWGTQVDIGKVNIRFFETATLHDVYIEDQAGDTLLWAEFMKADIGAFALFGQSLELNEVALEDAYINLYRLQDSTRFNYEFIVESFTSDSVAADTTSANWEFDLLQARLENVRLRYSDEWESLDLYVDAPYLLADLETLGLGEQFIRISNIDIRELEGYYEQVLPAAAENDSLATEAAVAQALDSAFLNPSGFRISVEDFTVEDSRFHYLASREAEKGTINFENLDLYNINIGISDFYLAGDTLLGSIDQLAAIDENSGFVLENLAMNVALEMPYVSGSLQEFITPNSRITDPIVLEQFSLNPSDDMLSKLQMVANVENAIIGMQDVSYFVSGLDTLPKLSSLNLLMDLEAKITDNRAVVVPLKLRTEDGGLSLIATAKATGLNNLETMRFQVTLEELNTTPAYLQQFAFVDEIPPSVRYAGNLELTAQAEGTLDDIDFDMRLRSGLGTLQTDLRYLTTAGEGYAVSGNLSAQNFNLQTFVDDSVALGEVSFHSKVQISGNGAQFDVEKFALLVNKLEYNDYTYEGLALEGYFVDSVLEVAAAYEDPFLNFDMLLYSDMQDSLPLVKAELDLEKANLYRLNLSPDSIIVSTALVADIKGQELDDIRGAVVMRDTEVIRGANSWVMDSLVLSSVTTPGGLREISLLTEFMSAELTGKYLFKDLPLAFEQCAAYYCSAYRPSADMVDYGQEIELNVRMWDEPIIAKAFLPELELLYPLTLSAELRDSEKAFDLDLVAPGITWADSIIIKDLRADASTIERVMTFELAADQIVVGDLVDIPLFGLEGRWARDSVHFDMALAPSTDSTHLLLGGAFTFDNDTIALALDQTDLALEGRAYELADDAIFKISGDYLYINDFMLRRGEQYIAIDTELENTQSPHLIAVINDFRVSEILDALDLNEWGMTATLDGKIELINPLDLEAIEAKMAIEQLVLDSIVVGDIAIAMNKQANSNRILTDVALEGPGNKVAIEGYFTVEGETQPIAMEIDVANLNLAPWGVFMDDFVTDLQGRLRGSLAIAGTLEEPQVEGRLNFTKNTAFRLGLTGSRYRLINNDYIEIDDQAILLNDFTLYDSLNQKMVVDGEIFHESLTDYRFDLAFFTTNFQIVNKPRDLDGLFFGKLFLTSEGRISGPLEDILVTGEVRVGDKTDFALVVQNEESMAGTASWIDFVEKNAFLERDTVSYLGRVDADTAENVATPDYFTLRATVVVPPAATFVVVVDPNTGDYLEVKGSADLRVSMEPTGDINMQGVYEVEEGRYRLSFMEVIQKSFFIEEGSTVVFNGDPLNAELNLTAVYTTEASRLALVNLEAGDPQYAAARRKEPVSVLLNISGWLEDPVFAFDIVVPEAEYGTFSSVVAQELDAINSNETELFRQVFGLIVLNRFLPQEGIGSAPGGGGPAGAVASRIDASVSQFLSQQLNAVTQDYLGVELELNIDSQNGGGEANLLGGGRDVGFTLRRSLFNDRVQVEFGGSTAVGTNRGGGTTTPSNGAGFMGNFAILYHINEKGNLNLKIFQRNDRDLIANEIINRSGVAISYFKRFDSLQGLFGEEPRRYEMLKSDGPVHTEL